MKEKWKQKEGYDNDDNYSKNHDCGYYEHLSLFS